MTEAIPIRRADYRYWASIPTRWSDNDMLGHVNNVLYFRFFEAVVVRFLIEEAKLDWRAAPAIPFAVDIRCHFRRPLSFPEVVDAGLHIDRLGTTSVGYGLALFASRAEDAAALGQFVHVYVDRATQTPVAIPDAIRNLYRRYLRSEA